MSRATPWIFLRGLTRDSRHWGSFPQMFRQQIPDAEVVALDLPGNGYLHGESSPSGVEAMATWCREELHRRGIPPPWNVLAMSLGAMVTIAWAARYPQELQACVLINTSVRPFSPFHHRLRPAAYLPVLRMIFTTPGARICEETILQLTSRRLDRTRTVLDDWERWRLEQPVSRANALRQLLAAARFCAPVTPPSTRLLVLASAQDGLVDTRCSRQLANAWQCDIAEHPDAGHDLPLDDGAWVTAEVRRWLYS